MEIEINNILKNYKIITISLLFSFELWYFFRKMIIYQRLASTEKKERAKITFLII